MRPLGFALILLVLLAGLTGCLISTQEGERSHVNSKHPEEITFHFDTGYNKAVLFGRSAALLLVPLWVFAKRRGGGNTIPAIVGVLALGGAVWLLVSGVGTTFGLPDRGRERSIAGRRAAAGRV